MKIASRMLIAFVAQQMLATALRCDDQQVIEVANENVVPEIAVPEQLMGVATGEIPDTMAISAGSGTTKKQGIHQETGAQPGVSKGEVKTVRFFLSMSSSNNASRKCISPIKTWRKTPNQWDINGTYIIPAARHVLRGVLLAQSVLLRANSANRVSASVPAL